MGKLFLKSCKLGITLFIATISLNLWAQYEITCQDNNCHYPPLLNVAPLNLTDFTRFEVTGLNDSLIVSTPDGQRPRDLRTYVLTRDPSGQNVKFDVKSTKENARGANFIMIGDSVKNLEINSNGFNGGNYLNASLLCAKNIKDGLYDSAIKTKFLQRRVADPSIPSGACDEIDLAMIQSEGSVSCSSGYQELPTPNVKGTRWKPKRECRANAGRAMCVEKRVLLRCDQYANKGSSPCCDLGAPPTPNSASYPTWQCNPLKCSATESGWYRRYNFRMWETEYSELAYNGFSNELICDNKIAQSTGISNTDNVTIKDRYYESSISYAGTATDFNIMPPGGETVVSAQYAAGICGSYDDNANPAFDDYSEFFTPGADYIRMRGKGHKVNCSGVSTDYPVGSYCRSALEQRADINLCTGTFNDHPVGNQCWEELTPVCTGSYASYTPGSYCYNQLIYQNCTGDYTSYPVGTYCHNRLKRESCAGPYTNYQPGETCWISNQSSCTGSYTDYAEGSYCWQNLHPICAIPDGGGVCSNYLSQYPSNAVCTGSYTDYPVGSKCWKDLWPACPGSYTSYPVDSFCYNKLAPTCSGSYKDYSVGSYCYNKLLPEVCSGDFTSYEEGSFCYTTNRPTCTGSYTDYNEGSYCYYRLLPNCTGAYTDYPLGSYCRRALSPGICEGTFDSHPAGSYCWQTLQPSCSGVYTDYTAGSYCYNYLYPGQSTENTNAQNCSVVSGVGSLCWKESFGSCELQAGDPPHAPGSYCYNKDLSAGGYCGRSYSDYPKGSYCWETKRELPDAFYYNPNSCAVKCEFNGSYVSCNIGTPVLETPHVETPAGFVGQRVHKDAYASFKVRIKTLNALGLEKNNDTEVRIKVKALTPN